MNAWFRGFQFQFFKNMYLFNIIMTGCLLDISDLRILQLLHRNLPLMFGSPSLLFYLDVLESFKLLFCNVFFTSATRILNENPV